VRVTNQMMNAAMMGNLNTLRSRNASLTEQISSGNRITKASEDPNSAGAVMRSQSRLQVLFQWEQNLTDTQDWVNGTESALGHMTDLLSQVKEKAIQGSNTFLDANSREAVAQEIDNMFQDLLTTLNGKQGDLAMFGGFKTTGDPFTFDSATGAVTYNGDTGDLQRDVGPGVTMTANMNGGRLGNWASPDNMLTVVWQTIQDIKAGNATSMQTNLDDVDKAMQTTVSLRSEMGARQQRVEQLDSLHKDTYLQLHDALQQAQGVDVQKAILDLNNADTTYRAALQVGAKIMPPTLVDFLR
jgi:flagellar hook-associated protein 3 FlgL